MEHPNCKTQVGKCVHRARFGGVLGIHPHNDSDVAVANAAVRARFDSAAIAGTQVNPYGATDPYRLARSPIQVSDGMRWFRRKVTGGMRFEDDIRRLVNRKRYVDATT